MTPLETYKVVKLQTDTEFFINEIVVKGTIGAPELNGVIAQAHKLVAETRLALDSLRKYDGK